MRVLVQRGGPSNVIIDEKINGEIQNGLVVFVGFTEGDSKEQIDYLVNKIVNLRIFPDENDVMNKSVLEVGGEILSISQFTLQANTKKGNRPSYINAMRGEDAIKLYELYNEELNKSIKTYPGVFGADMLVNIANDGPITIIIDTKE